MRLIGSLKDETHAKRFSAYLLTKEIQTQLDAYDGNYHLWVRDEDKVQQANDEFNQFKENPDDGIYRAAEAEAILIEKKAQQKVVDAQKNVVQASNNWSRLGVKRKQPLTIALTIICIVVFVWMHWINGGESYVYSKLAFLDTTTNLELDQSLQSRFQDIRNGEIWRTFTPAVMHVDELHIAMNLIGLVFLGGQIETNRGTWRYGVLIIFVAVISNLLQGCFGGLHFMGISGVVYGMCGYLWMKTIFEPDSGMYISEFLIILGVAWILAGIFGLTKLLGMGEMANWAHVGGLVAGVVVAMIPTLLTSFKNSERK